MNGSGQQRRTSYRLLLMILWATLVVLVVELTAGWVSHSLLLLAEALHTLVDAFSALVALIAVASPQRTLGKEIWGHGRGEAAGALLISAILGFAGISIILLAFGQFALALQTSRGAFAAEITLPLLILIALAISLLVADVFWVSSQCQQLSSLGLKLNVKHILSDVWLSGIVLMGLVAIAWGYRWLDALLAPIVVVLAAKSLWQMLQQQLPMLLQPTAIAPEAIAQIACQVEGVTRCTRILSRGMVGRQVWIELHLSLHPEFMIIAQTIGERVERSLREHYGPVRAQIWLDHPYKNLPDKLPPVL